MTPQRTRLEKKRRSPRATLIWVVIGSLLVTTVLNVLVIHHQMPSESQHSGMMHPFSALAKEMALRHQQNRGIVEHNVLQRLQRLLQARWDHLQHTSPQVPLLDGQNATSMEEEKKDAVNVTTDLKPQNTTFREEDKEDIAFKSTIGKDQQPNLGVLLQQRNMSSLLLDALKQYNATYHDNARTPMATCRIPVVDTTTTACTETNYTVLAVVAAKNPRRLFLNVLRWFRDTAVTDIRIVLPASASGLLQRDTVYGARLSAWDRSHRIRLLFASKTTNLWEALSKDAPVKTRAVVWRDGNEKVTQKHPSVLAATEVAAGWTLWKQTPTALVAWAPIHVETANITVTLPHWNGLFHDRDWLCLLANEPFRTLVWDDWEYALQAMVLFLGHLSTLQYYSTTTSSTALPLEAVAALFGGYPLPEERPVASRTCG
jgi:hypothetical protein